jgi:hypothetical protein
VTALSALEALDQLLSTSNPDSMRWADGGGHEDATELLGELDAAEWQALTDQVGERSCLWRQCLASALRPQQGDLAAALLLDLANDSDVEVASTALSAVAFHCGVNDSAEGVFIDASIRVPGFLSLARASTTLQHAIQRLSSGGICHPAFVGRFRLLAREIAS